MKPDRKQGIFLTLEGIEGAGKSTQCEYIRGELESAGHTVVRTREPGGTALGELIRGLLLESGEPAIEAAAELMLIFAARAQHLQQVIRPALARGDIVLCDRFTDATYAYQGGGRGVPGDRITILEDFVQEGLKPDHTILLDVPVDTGLGRADRRGEKDRIESETLQFFNHVRQAYLVLAESEPGRVHVIDADRPVEQVQKAVRALLEELGLC